VRQVYRECASYEDAGEVVTVHKYKTGLFGRRIEKTQRFSTLFVRPDLYRFELVDVGYGSVKEWTSGAVWSADGVCRSWMKARPQVREHESIDTVHGLLGDSSRASARIPDLLMGAADRADSNDDASTVRIARARRVACYVLAVPFGQNLEEMLWIACDSGLIVQAGWELMLDARSREQARLATEQMLASDEVPEAMQARVRASMERMASRDQPDTKVTTTTTYRPTIDAPIEPERFAFSPPFVGPAAWEMP
jgi:hypothetical protein